MFFLNIKETMPKIIHPFYTLPLTIRTESSTKEEFKT